MKQKVFKCNPVRSFDGFVNTTFVSCKDYDDDIENLQGQINANAEAIKTINDLVAKGSVISSVEPTANGIIIKLSDGKSYTIENGKDGNDGKPADVWTIGEDGFLVQE